jgi:4-amino-4-deoxy-L-arabinose transferase-like glycosyltransferase
MIVLLGAITYRLWTFGKPELDGYDEQIYGYYVRTLGEQGAAGLRSAIHEWPTHAWLREGPLPFRIAYIACGTGMCRLFGAYDLNALAMLSLGCGIAAVMLGFLLARRWFNTPTAIAAGALLVTSPLATALSRRALQDSMFTLLILASILLLDEYWHRKRRLTLLALTLAMTSAFLAKETFWLLYPVFGAALLLYGRQNGWSGRWGLLVPFGLSPLIALAVAIWLAGDWTTLWQTYTLYAGMQSKIGYAQAFQQGPWFRYAVDLCLLGPVPLALAVAGIAAMRTGDGRRVATLYLVGGIAVFSLLPLLNARLILFADTPLRILAAAALIAFARGSDTQPRRIWVAAPMVLAVAILDWRLFEQVFVQGKVYDPVTAHLIHALGFLPK